tara:strand:- start:5267 stop:5974 length:708 start_codon:yes stop_codon:yes gene_type:complete
MELDGFGNKIPESPNESGNEEDLTLSIKGVRTKLSEISDEYILELNTTRGVIKSHLRACEGKTAFVIFIGGASGSSSGPANKVYEKIGSALVGHGISSLRLEYRKPGDFAESVVDVLAGCSFMRGIGAREALVVGHSFGGAVAIKAGELSDLVKGVTAISSQLFGTQDVHQLNKPLLLIHGDQDEILHHEASEDIFRRASDPKSIEIIQGSGHAFQEDPEAVYSLLEKFIVSVVG